MMRILLIRPCCIGDVVMATAALSALRDAYPQAHITWAVGGWSRHAIDYHPAVDDFLDTGNAALPVKSWAGFWQFVSQMRAGQFDIVISLVRSPLMSLAVLLSGIPKRVGIDSNRRGFGYNLKYRVNPNKVQHEAQIYLNVVAQLGINTEGYQVNLPLVTENPRKIKKPYIVINPAGGSNPGMILNSKRWLPENFATVANTLTAEYNADLVLLAGPDDMPILEAVQQHLKTEAQVFAGSLSFPEIGALASEALLYVGNDTGLTHLAAASGAKTAMVMGISDPARYAPFTENSLVLWKPTTLKSGGVAALTDTSWDWHRDGISVDDALTQLREFLS